LLVTLIVLSITACGKTIKTDDGEISLKDGEVEIKTEDGSTTVEDGKITFEGEDGSAVLEASEDGVDLPDGFPQDLVPIIDDSIILMAIGGNDEGGEEYSITALTNTEVKDVVDFYKDIMSDAEDSTTVAAGDMNIFAGLKNGIHVTITISPTDEDEYKAMISIITVREE